ncbi:cellulase family glycosylhydrolase [Corynebacterium poyangense]|uniref:Beta-galactosidase n=1 Tax=Corynebacterium poyangense TaxID=2684405 RepID=A0A7H0SLP7_9CORY|nr:beta-galactosidase [Corynebacterium poyangense]MBZ8177578.1 cellulase family glycosylhydrolase [Corynebacterium poyangense]QNQ89472.1 cellulase family glycosylhydrolase [Corynebacterium poyangense]
MLRGVDYYPEHWPEELLDEDLDRICRMGANTIRIGEFAWHLMEPTEGEYHFDFFDRVIEAAKKRGLTIIFGTPTATPPAWLAHNYNIASVSINGQQRSFGGRHTASLSSPDYLKAAKKIVRNLAQHYARESAIIAWQIDNELGHEGADVCWSHHSKKAFQHWLEQRYNSIEELNQRWGTIFWSQTYNNFQEIPLPAPTITTHNPTLRLEWARFCSWRIEEFCRLQTQWIKDYIPNAICMHDFPGGGLYKTVDYSRTAKHIDKVGYNNYPVWGGQMTPIPPHKIAFDLDYIRGLKKSSFWITEAIMGAQGHDITGYLPRPGQAAMWSVQALARGADGLSYFRYRGATKGAEQFCYGIINPDNIEGRRFLEVRDVFSFFKKNEKVFSEKISAPVAIIADFDSRMAFQIQQQAKHLDVVQEMMKWHRECHSRNIMTDVIASDADFSGYQLIIVPHHIIYSPTVCHRLQRAAQAGAHVLVTCRSLVKDQDNNLVFAQSLPLHSQDWLGIRVEETESVAETNAFCLRTPVGNNSLTNLLLPSPVSAGVLRDMLSVEPGTQVLYEYDDPFFPEYAAFTHRPLGKGATWYLGTIPGPQLRSVIIDTLLNSIGFTGIDSPDGVEIIKRGTHQVIINHCPVTQEVLGISIPPYGFQIMEE